MTELTIFIMCNTAFSCFMTGWLLGVYHFINIGFGQMVVQVSSKCMCVSMVVFVAHKIQCVTFVELFWDWTWKRRARCCWCMHKNCTSKGTNEVCRNEPSICWVNSQMVYNNDGRSVSKEKQCVEDFLGGHKCGLLTHISGQHGVRNSRISFN